MKFIIRYCTQWGNFSTRTITITNVETQISDLRQQIATITELDATNITLTIMDKVQLVDSKTISDYNIQNNSIIYVSQKEKKIEEETETNEKQIKEINKYFSQNKRYFSKLGIIQEESSLQSVCDEELKKCIPNIINTTPQMDFINFIRSNDWKSALPLLKQIGIEAINDIRITGWNGLHYACYLGFRQIVQELMNLNADVNHKTSDDWTPLQLAVFKNHSQVVEILVGRAELDVNYSSHKKNALQIAAKRCNVSIVRLIMAHKSFNVTKIKLDDFDQKHCTPQCYEIIQNRLNYQQLVIEEGDTNDIIGRKNDIDTKSFMNKVVNKPQILEGYLTKLHIIRLIKYDRYFKIDAENGSLCRYKHKNDYPLKPIEVIALENICRVNILDPQWFLDKNYHYLQIVYKPQNTSTSQFIVCSQSIEKINIWKETLNKAIEYSKYLTHKLSSLYQQGQNDKVVECISFLDCNQTSVILQKSFAQNEASQIYMQENSYQSSSYQSNALGSNIETTLESPMEPSLKQKQKQKFYPYLKQFQVLEKIGHGAFGRVFKVRHLQNGQLFAMKQLQKSKLISQKQIKYAVSECNILKQVHCPYIVNLIQSFQTRMFLYLVMEYCSGGDLALHLSRVGKFEEKTTKMIIKELILALEHLHSLDIIYRDLKPENILINEQGHVKLVDFGLSKQVQNDMKAKSFCGSPAYLSPEVVNRKGSTKATDIYGLGTVMYELLSGNPPFYHEDIEILYNNIRNGMTELQFPTDISDEAVNFMSALLQKDPQNRLGCKNVNQVNWNQLKKHSWFQNKFFQMDEAIKIISDDSVDWISGDENDDKSLQTLRIKDEDYNENDWNINRILSWSYDSLNIF